MPRRSVLTTERSGLVGHVIDDRYQVVKKLARGGMATVYVAHDLRLSRTVAVKVMNEGLGDTAEFTARFDAEARAAAHLSHPNVVSVFDQGSDDGRPYIVMEYVQGFTLRQLITREAPMDPRRAVELIEPVAAALAAAHAAGLIHRDVKPENVLISDRGQVKVADFGLARAVTAHTSASTAGLVIGTVSYIAPELVTKGHADARSDVYSLGIVLYEMLTGRKPHTGDSPIQVAYSHVHNQITAPSLEVSTMWRDGRGGIPPYLDALVTTAANRERAQRPEDAGVLLGHLRAVKDAMARGVLDDPELSARVRRADPGPAPARPVPAAPRMGAERHFTPVTPVSPSFDVSADGAPFYTNGPSPYSPASPHTASVPTLTQRTPRPGPRWGRITALIAALALIAGLGWGGWYLLEGRYTATPPLVKMTQTDAQAAAQSAEVAVVFEREFSEDVPAGQVIRTVPAPGDRVLRDGVVTAWVSRGPERFAVPNVAGKKLEDARAAIQSASLQVGEVKQEFSDSVAADVVISQGTKPDTQARRDDAVALVVSSGPAPVEVVDFTGKKLTDAQAWAGQNKITLNTSEENHDTVPKGSVIRQEPTTELRRGGAITLVVSKGPVMVTVPTGLRGQGADTVADRIRQAGLEPKFEKLVAGGFGLVLNVEPGEGASVPKGSTVVIKLV